MRKYWLYMVGLTTTLGISLMCLAGPGHATPAPQSHAALQEANCGNFKEDKPWGSAEGTVCWKGGQSKGEVRDKKDDGKCVWVRLWYTMEDGNTHKVDSPKACGEGTVESVTGPSPEKSVSVKGRLMHG
ncbi:hypothetical protein DMH04_24230 [Kibdelosporangium aridum]|uniref:Uncharacterized protein n=1 Tax=Kibdelosporangium aridum TaxID=2030 RepID=A0A428Z729_KIBAR|nr:hypothetical protein [Kibdelosporangium aridum]RSM83234.1 hypothetical protein DMH04_24230 [Kibdelosporangium aridum]